MSAGSRLVYLSADSPSLDEIASLLATAFDTATVGRSGDELHVTFGDWTARIVDFRESWVNEEARETAQRAPTNVRPILESSVRRLEIYDSGDADADDHHYNDSLFLWETCIDLPGAVGQDPFDDLFRISARVAKASMKGRARTPTKAAPNRDPATKPAPNRPTKAPVKKPPPKPSRKAPAKPPAKKTIPTTTSPRKQSKNRPRCS